MFQQFAQIKSLAFLLAIFVLLLFLGCGTSDNIMTPEARTTPGTYTSMDEVMSLVKSHSDTIPVEVQASDVPMAPMLKDKEESKEIGPGGGKIRINISRLDARIKFIVPSGALEQTTLISMRVFLEMVEAGNGDLNTLFFEFGPSGTQFDPCAQLIIPFELLLAYSVDEFTLTVESEGTIEGVTYDVDEVNGIVIAYVPHFSVYYLGRR